MATRFVPVTFDLIEEGELKMSVDEAIKEATARLLRHVRDYGPDAAEKSKAEVNLKITIVFEGGEDYSIKGAITSKYPGRPVKVSRAIHEVDQLGEETLFVRGAGSDDLTPRQGKLATNDGRPIDIETGKAPPRDGKDPKKD